MKTTHLLSSCFALLMAATLTTLAEDSKDNKGQLSASDYKFAKTAAVGGMFEVNAGNIAAANSSNPAVQQFGQQMVKDHGKAGDELKQIASTKGVTLPAELPAMKQKEIDKLSKLNGPEFDRVYLEMMVKAHKADEKMFKHASESLSDTDLKNFAGNTLAVVQSHLQMVEGLRDSTKQASNK